MKVMLINSPYDLMGKGYRSKTKIKRGFFSPLGLGYLGAALLKNNVEVSIVDSVVEQLPIDEIINRIKMFNPDIIGMSVMTPGSYEAYSAADEIKKSFPDSIIILGGPHPTSFPEEVMTQCKSVDYVLTGEAEFSLPELVKCIQNNKTGIENIKGLFYRTADKNFKDTGIPEYVKDLDIIDFPARQLFNNDIYIPLPNFSKRIPAASMVTSRGCPYGRCKFCYQSGKFGAKFRRRSVNNVIDEIKTLILNYKIREVAFYDSLFAFDEKWILQFCAELLKNKIDITWSCFAQISFITKEMLVKMKEAGCFNIYYGIESGNQELLDYIRKRTTIEKIKEIVNFTHSLGIETRGSFIIGLPKSSPEKDLKTIQFAIELNLDYAGFFPYRVYKGTELSEEAQFYGKVLADRADGHHSATYIPEGYESLEQVQKMTKYAYRKFYFRCGYVVKSLKKIKSFGDLKRIIAGLKLLLGFSC